MRSRSDLPTLAVVARRSAWPAAAARIAEPFGARRVALHDDQVPDDARGGRPRPPGVGEPRRRPRDGDRTGVAASAAGRASAAVERTEGRHEYRGSAARAA